MQDHARGQAMPGAANVPGADSGRGKVAGQASRSGPQDRLDVAVIAAVISVHENHPVVLVRPAGATGSATLPCGRFRPSHHGTLEEAADEAIPPLVRPTVGAIEQLAARSYGSIDAGAGGHALTVAYLGLSREDPAADTDGWAWVPVYDVLPWEDWRGGPPACLAQTLVPTLMAWARGRDAAAPDAAQQTVDRVRIAFGQDGCGWDDERVVERFELLGEAAVRPSTGDEGLCDAQVRILAAALGRLRARLRYRPVVFDLLPPEFTLFEMQRVVEAILGPNLHKQNFRRLVESMRLVEPTGQVRAKTGGRPAKLFRFRREVLLEHAAPGVRIRPGKVA